jgi:hypothetical protein
MDSGGEEKAWFSYVDEQGREVQVSGTDHYDHLRQINHETAYRRWRDSEGQEVTRRERLALRSIFPQEMEALLHYNGFTVEHRYGDWKLHSPTDKSQNIVYVCRRASS